MVRAKKLAGMALAAALVIGGLTAGSAAAIPHDDLRRGFRQTKTGTLSDGATYEIQCPTGAWNGTLFLYSHGYVDHPARPTRPRTSATRSPAPSCSATATP